MIEIRTADGADHASHVGLLPRRAGCAKHFFDAHGPQLVEELAAEDAVSVTQQALWDLVKRKGLSQLLRCPLCCGMGRYVEMHDTAPLVSQNHEDAEDLEPDRRHGEEVLRDHGIHVVLKERPPGL